MPSGERRTATGQRDPVGPRTGTRGRNEGPERQIEGPEGPGESRSRSPGRESRECRASLTSVNYARGRGLSCLVRLLSLPSSVSCCLRLSAAWRHFPAERNQHPSLPFEKGEAFRPRRHDADEGEPGTPWPRRCEGGVQPASSNSRPFRRPRLCDHES